MSNLANYIFDRAIDYIENRERDSDIRQAYAQFMSENNWNNQEMAKVLDIVCIFVNDEIGGCRSQREEDQLIKDLIVTVVDANCGAFALSDRRISDSVPDNVYNELKRADGLWYDLVGRAENNGRGRGRGRDDRGRNDRGRDDRYGRDDRNHQGRSNGRSVFDRSRSFGETGNIFDRSEQNELSQGSNSVFHRSINNDQPSRPVSTEREERRQEPQQYQSQRGGYTQDPAPSRQEEQDGPDLSAKRPYDNFWSNGENWQIAHRSKFIWTSTEAQRARRTYDPHKFVAFLVKGVNGIVREEFLPVTQDLEEEAHTIRSQNRPFMRRATAERAARDASSTSLDLDVVDVDHDRLAEIAKQVPKLIAADIVASFRTVKEQTTSVTTVEEAVVKVSGEAIKNDSDVTVVSNILSVQLPGDAKSNEAMVAIKAVVNSDGNLLQLQQRLQSLRGTLGENVLQYLDKHFTKEVNSALHDQFGMYSVKIGSFIEDFSDLLECNTFKKEGPAFSSQFLSRTRMLLSSIQFLVEPELREQFCTCEDLMKATEEDPQAYRDYCNNLVILFKPLAVVHVRMHSTGLGMVSDVVRSPSTDGMVADPALAELLVDLYAAGREVSGAGQVILVTDDNLVYELVPIGARREKVGIRTFS